MYEMRVPEVRRRSRTEIEVHRGRGPIGATWPSSSIAQRVLAGLASQLPERISWNGFSGSGAGRLPSGIRGSCGRTSIVTS